MKFDIVTIFPRMFDALVAEGIVARAIARGLVDLRVHDLRDFTEDRHRTVDDVPFGGGPGMVLKVKPVVDAVERIRRHDHPAPHPPLDLRLRLHHLAVRAEAKEELAESRRQILRVDATEAPVAGGLIDRRDARGDRDVDDGWRNARRDGFHGVVECGQRGDARVVERTGCSGSMSPAVIEEKCGREEHRGEDAGRDGEFFCLCY